MLILNQSSDTIFVEEESENRNGGGIAFYPIHSGETHNVEPSWVYRIHSHTRGSAVITSQGEGPVTFGNLKVNAKDDIIIIT